MNNKDIKLEDINIKEETNNTISVNITNETEVLLAAHNASSEAHSNIIEKTDAKIDIINNAIERLKSNVVSISDLPQKLSDLQNDMNFVSEETLIGAIEARGLINSTILAQKEAELNNLINTSNSIQDTKIENLKNNLFSLTKPSAITNLCMPSDEQIMLIPSATTGEFNFTMPADGVLHARGRARTDVGILIVKRTATDTQRMLTIYPKDHPGSFELLVRKGEIMNVWTQNFTIDIVKFSYLNGTIPQSDENQEQTPA